MNSGLVHSELNYNFRLFAKTISSSAAWGFDRFRLFNSKWHTKVQVRRLDGSVVATQSFAPDGAFEHTFSFDLSGNVTNEEYSVYIAGVAVGQNFNQAYAWPTGYSATTGKNAELTYWDFSQVNIVFSGTSGRIRFENNPITAIGGASLLNAGEINFANCQLDAETLADMLIGLNTNGGTGGSFNYSGNLAAPAERALSAYNSLKDTKAWTLTGAIPAAAATVEAETTTYIDRVTADAGAIIDEAFVDTFYSTLKGQAIYTNLSFWMSAKAGMKKDASQFISKVYDLAPTFADPAQTAGAAQPDYSLNKINFSIDSLQMASSKTLSRQGGTLFINFTLNSFNGIIIDLNTTGYSYIQIRVDAVLVYNNGQATGNSYACAPVIGVNELFLVRNALNEDLYLNGAFVASSIMPNVAAEDLLFNQIGKYDVSSNYLNGSIQSLGLFNTPLTLAQRDAVKVL